MTWLDYCKVELPLKTIWTAYWLGLPPLIRIYLPSMISLEETAWDPPLL